MRIGFDAKRLFNNTTGLGEYSRNLVSNLITYFPKNEYFLYANKITIEPSLTLLKAQIIQPEKKLNFLWRQFEIDKDIQKYKLDIYHGLSNEIPFKRNSSTRYICTIHDLIWLKFPELYKPLDRMIYTHKLKYACKHADLLIATSQQTSEDLQAIMKVPSAKIQVVYQTGPNFSKTVEVEPPITAPYFLYISTFEERKNHLTLLYAFYHMVNRGEYKLVLAGRPGNTSLKVKEFISEHSLEENVIILENISEAEKFRWLKYASAFVYPSFYEGFGIPLIEAIRTETPLILSNLSVFKEIAQNFAQYFEPRDIASLRKLLESFIENKTDSKMNYRVLLETFSPQTTSERLMEAYERVL